MAFEPPISPTFVSNGQLVNAANTNRGPESNNQNIEYLFSLLSTISTGKALIAYSQALDASVEVGQPVYYDADDSEFKPAIAAASGSGDGGSIVTSDSSQVWGVVKSKSSDVLGDVLLAGVASVDLSEAIDGTIAKGLYYLSTGTAGELTSSKPSIAIPVLYVMGPSSSGSTYEVFVNSQFGDVLTEHIHYKFTLDAVPSGDYTAGATEITNADDTIEGWLPASHSSFGGNAPAGAAFGYNIAESALSSIWPPVPQGTARIEITHAYDDQLPTTADVTDTLVTIDDNGIWWMTDCVYRLPWDYGLDYVDGATTTSASESVDCVDYSPSIVLWYVKPQGNTATTSVLSLQAASGSGISIADATTGEAATTGNLVLDVDLNLAVNSESASGYQVLKTIDGQTFTKGPVVEAVKLDSEEWSLSGTGGSDANGYHYGKLTISGADALDGKTIPLDSVHLNGVEETYEDGLSGLEFRANKTSGMALKTGLDPYSSVSTTLTLKLRLWVKAGGAGTIPNSVFSLTYRRLTKPTNTLSASSIPTSDTTISIPMGITVSADEYFIAESDSFTVTGGDTVLFYLERDGSAVSDTYESSIITIRQEAILGVGS